jgi:hypothetical protein
MILLDVIRVIKLTRCMDKVRGGNKLKKLRLYSMKERDNSEDLSADGETYSMEFREIEWKRVFT